MRYGQHHYGLMEWLREFFLQREKGTRLYRVTQRYVEERRIYVIARSKEEAKKLAYDIETDHAFDGDTLSKQGTKTVGVELLEEAFVLEALEKDAQRDKAVEAAEAQKKLAEFFQEALVAAEKNPATPED